MDRVGVRPAVGRRSQQADDARDSKAATLIGATVVVLGLVRPNADADDATEWAALTVVLVVIAYALVASFAAYSVNLESRWCSLDH